jgi:oligopeptide transport system ATP-binding protein
MHFGKIVELGTSDEIYYHPLHDYTKSLLSAIPQPDPDSERTRKRIVKDDNKFRQTFLILQFFQNALLLYDQKYI